MPYIIIIIINVGHDHFFLHSPSWLYHVIDGKKQAQFGTIEGTPQNTSILLGSISRKIQQP